MLERSARLDMLRIFAAISVMGFHLGTGMSIPESGAAAEALERSHVSLPQLSAVWWGWIGVPIFFALSGFLIAGSLRNGALDFVRARLSRLLPGAIACSATTTILLLTIQPIDADLLLRFFRSATLWPFGPWIDSVYWTLGMELSFYAIVATLVWKGRSARLETAMTLLAGVSLLAWAASFLQGVYGPIVPGLPDRVVQLLLIKDAPFFAVGVLLHAVATSGWRIRRTMTLIVIAFLACLPIHAEAVVRAAQAGIAVPEIQASIVWLAAVGVIAMPLRTQSGKVLALLSRSTYPLYLLHSVGSAVVVVHLRRAGVDVVPSLVVGAVLSMLAAVVITTWIEPVIRFVLFGRRQRRSAEA